MKIISHRGNYSGPRPDRENKPSYIDTALSMGLEVEVDVWSVGGVFMLGHDGPETAVSPQWISERIGALWLHCKNLEAAQALRGTPLAKFFCHTGDPYVLTSTGHIWVHDLSLNIDSNCIVPCFDESCPFDMMVSMPYAICTDMVKSYLTKNDEAR
jgi:hypothetical protein